MIVLSLFDGMSCGQIALERCGIQVDKYFASEVDKHTIKVTKHNYPDTIHIGDVTKVSYKNGTLYTEHGEYNVGKIDLVIGGSPCQSISNLGDGSGLAGKSGLFYHYLRIKNEVNPKYFLLENVIGKKSAVDEISELMGVSPVQICSSSFSAAKRKRLYWTNIPVDMNFEHSNIALKDVLDADPQPESVLTESRLKWLLGDGGKACIKKGYAAIDPIKANCLTARSDASWNCNYVNQNSVIRKLSCNEYEKLQTVPVDYTNVNGVPCSQRYKMLGNGWTVDVIAYIFKHIKESK